MELEQTTRPSSSGKVFRHTAGRIIVPREDLLMRITLHAERSSTRIRRGNPAGRPDECGFSLLELLVASFMSVMLVGGMLLMLDGLRDVQRDQMQLIDAQMTARLALEQMRHDIQMAGIGLAGLLSPLPVIEPRIDGGIDIHHNPNNLTARLVADMGGTGADLVVDDSSGFAPGMVVVVYDSSGAFDLTTLTSVTPGTLAHGGTLSKSYLASQGAAVKRVQTTSYSLQSVNGAFWLRRQEDAAPAQPVAVNVRSMNIVYLDDNVPAQPFIPSTIADQLRVTAIEVTVEVETEDERLNTTAERTVTLRTRITPRSAVLTS
jgi:hypothetical protein